MVRCDMAIIDFQVFKRYRLAMPGGSGKAEGLAVATQGRGWLT